MSVFYWCKFNIFPYAFFRFSWYATSYFWLSWCFCRLKRSIASFGSFDFDVAAQFYFFILFIEHVNIGKPIVFLNPLTKLLNRIYIVAEYCRLFLPYIGWLSKPWQLGFQDPATPIWRVLLIYIMILCSF